ncbi:MAG: TonB-dependent receptor [Chitinophagaceae bacterium]
MYRKLTLIIPGILYCFFTFAQKPEKIFQDDSTRQNPKYLSDVTIVGRYSKSDIQQMPEIVGTSIYAGKKNALIVLDNVNGNVVTNNMRQVMAKIPGIQIWESDGSGIQIGIAARGLSPNRSWEFNVRQNGYDIAADPYGYPEAYYNPQLQAVQRIEIVRGQGSLQYGPQFGGLVNYILRNGSEINKPFEFETQQTIGSNGLFNSYNALGGETKKYHYYAFFDHRNADGYRNNSRYYTNSGFGTFSFRFTDKFSLSTEVMRNNIRSQQPGGLTDAQLKQDIKQSFRSRNWFDITWTTAALNSNYQFNEKSKLNIKIFAVQGDRNSVGYIPFGGITIRDTINKTTNLYNPRNLNTDKYRNYGVEIRYLGDYKLGKTTNTFSVGARLYKGTTYRFAADGKGSVGTEYNMNLSDGIWTRDIDFNTINTAVHAENVFRIGEKLLLIPGLRYEYITGKASGRNGFSGSSEILLQSQKRNRGFMLAGIGSEYHLTKQTELYANITQAYRPVQFADLTAPPTTDMIDENLEDAKGYNADVGYRGKINNYLFFDISGYYLQYNNRIGVIVQQRTDGSFYNYRTNVGNSSSKGIESLVEFNPVKAFIKNAKWGDISFFISYGFTDARYGDFKVITKNSSNHLVETNLKDKKVENAPENIIRAGLTYTYKSFLLTGQLSHVSDAFADANNTITSSANAQNGVIPSYTVTDITATYRFSKSLHIKTGINNLTDKKYFTRRVGGYPGPGALPADGRTFFISVGAKL